MAEVSEPGLLLTLRWRGMDSNFQYAGAVNLIVASLFSPRALHRVRTAGGGLDDRAAGRAVARCSDAG